MCEFCTQHGEGEKWYLTMENYSLELLDQNDRRKYAADFLNGFHKRVPTSVKQLDSIRRTPLMALAKPILTMNSKSGPLRTGGADGRCRKDIRDGAGSGETSLRVPTCDHREYERSLLLRLDDGQATHGCLGRFVQP